MDQIASLLFVNFHDYDDTHYQQQYPQVMFSSRHYNGICDLIHAHFDPMDRSDHPVITYQDGVGYIFDSKLTRIKEEVVDRFKEIWSNNSTSNH